MGKTSKIKTFRIMIITLVTEKGKSCHNAVFCWENLHPDIFGIKTGSMNITKVSRLPKFPKSKFN